VFTQDYGVVYYLEVLCVYVCFFLTAKATLQYCVAGVIYDVICVSHGEVFTVFHPGIMLEYYLYAQVLVVVNVIHAAGV
jgi:hypothetical protein